MTEPTGRNQAFTALEMAVLGMLAGGFAISFMVVAALALRQAVQAGGW